MEWWGLARALHVLGVVLWIGGVAMVTSVLLPAVIEWRSGGSALSFFDHVEHAFARQARWTTALVGASGLYLVAAMGLWHRFLEVRYWWMTAMVAVWAVFTLLLFVVEPLFLRHSHATRSQSDARHALWLMLNLHRLLLALSIITIAGAVAGSHGASL